MAETAAAEALGRRTDPLHFTPTPAAPEMLAVPPQLRNRGSRASGLGKEDGERSPPQQRGHINIALHRKVCVLPGKNEKGLLLLQFPSPVGM